jgi:hypothetical protein
MSANGSISSSTTPPSREQKVSKIGDLIAGKDAAADPTPSQAAADGERRDRVSPEDLGAPQTPRPDAERPEIDLDDDDDDAQREEKKQRKSLREFAAEHGFSVKALMGLIATEAGESDEPLSFGQLRDHWKETRQYQTERTEFDDWRSTAQNEITIARRQVQDVFERIASIVPPQTLARVFEDSEFEHAQRINTAKAQLLEFFPQWRDPEEMGRARDSMANHLAQWGFSKQDLATIQHPMIVKYIHDNMRREARLAKLVQGSREQQPSKAPPSRKGHRPSVDDRAKALAEKGDKAAAVALLVDGAMRK